MYIGHDLYNGHKTYFFHPPAFAIFCCFCAVALLHLVRCDVIEIVVIYAQVYRFPEFRALGCPGCLQTMHTVCRMFVFHVSFIFATGTQQSSFGYVLIVVSLNN